MSEIEDDRRKREEMQRRARVEREFEMNQLRAERDAARAAADAVRECIKRGLDPYDLCADGGIEAWMVVDQELRARDRAAITGRGDCEEQRREGD